MNFDQAREVIRKVDGRGTPVPCSLTWISWDDKRPQSRGDLKQVDGLIPAPFKGDHLESFAMKKADGTGDHIYIIRWDLLQEVNYEPVR